MEAEPGGAAKAWCIAVPYVAALVVRQSVIPASAPCPGPVDAGWDPNCARRSWNPGPSAPGGAVGVEGEAATISILISILGASSKPDASRSTSMLVSDTERVGMPSESCGCEVVAGRAAEEDGDADADADAVLALMGNWVYVGGAELEPWYRDAEEEEEDAGACAWGDCSDCGCGCCWREKEGNESRLGDAGDPSGCSPSNTAG